MFQRKFLIVFLLFVASTVARDKYISDNYSKRAREDIEKISDQTEDKETESKSNPLAINKGEAVVEKFIETLMASERYLKMIESVERKLNHLDATFHERTNTILKYVSEMLRVLKAAPPEATEPMMHAIKTDLNKIKMTIAERLDQPSMRGGPDFHSDPALDARLTHLESQIKNIMGGVESIVTIISEVKSRQVAKTYQQKGDQLSSSLDSVSILNEFRKSLQDQKRKCDCNIWNPLVPRTGRVDRSERYPTDCYEIQMQGFNVSGIYKIKPEDMEPFYVLCDLVTSGGGWTVLQNRFDGSQDFYKGWNDYKNGFGNLAGEFWLGLEKLNYLTNQKLYELRVEIETQHGQEAYAVFSVFTVGPENEGYRISTLGTYYGTAGDSLSYHAGQKFSTLDSDNDEWKDGACAIEHGGAWWYKECDKSNLNGKYSTTPEENSGQTMYWISFKGPNFPLMKTKMMIRPLPASRPNELVDKSRKLLESVKLKPSSDSSQKKAPFNSRSRSPYKHDNRAEAFFPNYK